MWLRVSTRPFTFYGYGCTIFQGVFEHVHIGPAGDAGRVFLTRIISMPDLRLVREIPDAAFVVAIGLVSPAAVAGETR